MRTLIPDPLLVFTSDHFDILQGVMCCGVVGVTAGHPCTMAHRHRPGGQFHQTLVLAVHCQLICKTHTHICDPGPQNQSLGYIFLN